MLVFWTIGLALFVASLALASVRAETVVNWYWDSLGVLYGTSLYLSGLAGLYIACRKFWNTDESSELATSIVVVFLPALIGLIGSVHGYISVQHSISHLGANIDQSGMSDVHVTVLTSLLVGLCFSIVPTMLIAVGVFFRRNQRRTLAR